jgi:integrase
MERHIANMEARGCQSKSVELVRSEVTRLSGDLLDRRLDKITRRDLTAQHAKATGAHGPRAANRWVRHVLTIYVAVGVAPPPGKTRLNKTGRGTPPLSADEIKAFAAALQMVENPVVADWWRFVLLTSLRRADALAVRWADVRGDRLHRPDPKRAHGQLRPFDLPITAQVREILARQKKVEGNPFVFVGNHHGRQLRNPEKPGMPHAHRLRSTWASRAVDLDAPLYVIKSLMNHSLADDVTAGYARPSPETLARWAQIVADSLWADLQ